ncbi:NADH dehydrogenase [Pseudomonas alcaligenes]|uniref:NADH dehydrogenase n=1 Tax=Aquipseudomonas alcaligenes TaxID=43263 RepID=A0ABR7S774_AQUAC|nr:FAD-dependent oxidoreductase [Pseudomonas alcaligenes]MBC9252824.1 NADH dehydrogenase [Pseudomonas alcaligenes]
MSKAAAGSKVVIYGGGMAGAILAKELCSVAEVTLVDPNDYFEVPMAAPRSLVHPSFAEKAIVPFRQALPGVRHLRGKLTELTKSGGLVTLSSGQRINVSGDVSVLATGSSFSNSLMRASDATAGERKGFYSRYSQRIAEAERILIVGGGPIGIEVAGEISESYPNKQITILEAGPRVLAGTTVAASQFAVSVLSQRGVTILTGEKLVDSESTPRDVFSNAGVATTSSGRKIAYDLIVWCVGGKPNTDYMRPNFASLLNEKGQIKVTQNLRVVGKADLFALGDITDLDENKMAWHIAAQVKNSAFNIRQVLSGKSSEKSLKKHKAQTGNPMMAVTLGSQMGVVHLPVVGLIKCPALTRAAKAGHMLVPKYRKILGV